MMFAHAKSSKRESTPNRLGGFTLVELLITMTIIALLASAVLFAMMGAVGKGKSARTRAQVDRLHDIIETKLVRYTNLRVPIRIPPGTNRGQAAAMRLSALREMMRMELPDRISDVKDPPSTLPARPSLSAGYLRRSQRASWSNSYQGAECLYMIVALHQDGSRNGLEFFSQSEIGDIDDDGMPEILDGWGNPIEFLRWAPGLEDSPLQSNDPATNPDPFDPYKVQSGSFGLVPYIFSAGSDGKYGIKTDRAMDSGGPVSYSSTTPKNNPYENWGGGILFGAPNGQEGEHYDNISNHSTEP